jgi:hypothetical protein
MREYMMMYDMGHLNYTEADRSSYVGYIRERSDYIFDKYVKNVDRVSITKFNSHI